MIKYNFNAVIKAWLDAAPEDRNLAHGATILLMFFSLTETRSGTTTSCAISDATPDLLNRNSDGITNYA